MNELIVMGLLVVGLIIMFYFSDKHVYELERQLEEDTHE